MTRLRFALVALVFVLCGVLGTGLYHVARTLYDDHLLVRQLVRIEMQRQRAAQPRGSDAPAPK